MENEEEKERLAFENELKKAKLIAETGAKFGEFAKLPPEMESQWLDQISAFDHAFKNAKRIKMKQRLGNPELKLPSGLSDEEITHELKKVVDLLHKNNIALDTICEVEEKEIYRFIVEELLEEEVDDVSVAGWTTRFIYEEFHPNYEYDIKQSIEDFLRVLFNRQKKYLDMQLADEIISHNGSKLSSAETIAKLENFIDAIEDAQLKQLNFGESIIDEEKATQIVDITYELRSDGTNQLIKHQGQGVFTFKNVYGHYCINSINIPGLRL